MVESHWYAPCWKRACMRLKGGWLRGPRTHLFLIRARGRNAEDGLGAAAAGVVGAPAVTAAVTATAVTAAVTTTTTHAAAPRQPLHQRHGAQRHAANERKQP